MAHLGCFVPCEEAIISISDQICARICTVETCAVPQSSFQLDLTQMASILHKVTSKSLVLIDEFGKGTSPASGIAILGATLQKLSEIGCPTVCTTHFLEIFSMDILQDCSNGFKARRMAIQLPNDDNEEQDATPLFKLEDGVASSSAGLICAKRAGLNPKIVSRAGDIIQTISARHPILPLKEAMLSDYYVTGRDCDMLKFFFSVNSWQEAGEEDLRILIHKICQGL
jgi:DNA mismatch repair protein MSH5